MSYTLSLLDKSPIGAGQQASSALADTVALAKLADRHGFHRFWVAEHHATHELASSSPEVLAAFLLAQTSRIRIGSGGVMLQHYSAYKVAENFNLLASLAPGRVDLGVGKAPGGLPLSTRVLQSFHDAARKPDFASHLAELTAFLDGGEPQSDLPGTLAATPLPPIPVQRFLLGASADSAALAASLGWSFVYASHLNGDPANLERSFDAYRKATGGKTPVLALAAVVADDEAQAARLVEGLRIFKVHVDGAQSVSVGSREQAEEYARQCNATSYSIEEKTPNVLHGTARQVRAGLDELHRRHGVQEFIIDTPSIGRSARFASIEQLALEHAEHGAAGAFAALAV